MKTAIATVCLSGMLHEKLEAIAAAGFKHVELFENDLLSFNGSTADVRQIANDLGLDIVTFQPFRDFEGMPGEKRARAFQRAERKFDVMAELGCPLLMLCSNVAPDSLGGLDRAADDLRDLGAAAAKRGIKIGFEALAWGRHISDYRDAWEAVRRADHVNVGLVLDTFHLFARQCDLRALYNIPGDRIALVQLADAPLLNMDYLSWSRHYRSFPGQGDLPITDFMTALMATGYDGILSLEIFNDEFRSGSTRAIAIDGHRSLITLLDDTQRRTPQKSMQAPLPPRAACRGTAFIEFAVDDIAGPAFDTVLTGLGFTKSGQHVSKAVTRWTQGDINIVTNREKDGFAHSFNLARGTAVCAIGLAVDDAAATLDRAERLRDTPFRQAVGPGELEMPAVRGLGGSLIYFIDRKTDLARVWDIEFRPLAASGTADAGLTTVDHISQSMHYEEMLSWSLFFTSLFDLERLAAQDVLDPGGLVKSLVVQAPDGAVRLPLNASQSGRTQSSRFLNEAFGSGVQHIALASRDLFATAARLAANGVVTLKIPENYYDDLEAKTDLSMAEIERLQAANILYEKDASGGEFLQLYTSTFDDRFFFEIVERRGGYGGFGASNAQVRLSAQALAARPASLPRR